MRKIYIDCGELDGATGVILGDDGMPVDAVICGVRTYSMPAQHRDGVYDMLAECCSIEFVFDDAPVRAADDAMMLRVIRSAFAMRRKTLANNLTAAFALPREEAAALIESLGLDARVRGEALSIAQLAALSDKLSAR